MKWKPEDFIAVIITLSICSGVIIAVYDVHINHSKLSDEGIKVTGGIIMTLLAILSIYVGSKIKKE